MAKQKKLYKEYKERVEFLKTLDKDILVGILLGVSGQANKSHYKMFARYIKSLKGKEQ